MAGRWVEIVIARLTIGRCDDDVEACPGLEESCDSCDQQQPRVITNSFVALSFSVFSLSSSPTPTTRSESSQFINQTPQLSSITLNTPTPGSQLSPFLRIIRVYQRHSSNTASSQYAVQIFHRQKSLRLCSRPLFPDRSRLERRQGEHSP